ncbi:DUF397 domain-containing protein [Streptomyces sp. NBC_00878]|uniref:DUF397 domain-containing protein n=1 Tax=Streptomyces sp. NBC_00878 TaxID=2975854 RepID=UPI0022516A2E|nr:DUF397 domain-containing protein [Streptomyces sp. NBC_00878]MCX4908191.1 DUF397 domain-containing protein [Streptomyces sp. NBC_00878]
MSEPMWQKSSFSGDDANRDCVEVATAPGGGTLLLRESDAPDAVLRTAPASLRALLGAARSGLFGTPAACVSRSSD